MGPAGEVFFAKLSLKKADLGFLIKLLYHKEVCNSLLPFFEERQGFLPSFSSLKSEVAVAGWSSCHARGAAMCVSPRVGVRSSG